MIERYTEKAIRILLLAQEEALLARHGRLYPEHLLLGIMREGSGLSAKLLKASGVTMADLREAIHKCHPENKQEISSQESMPFSEEAKRTLRAAWYEGQASGTYYVTPENIFLSLISKKESTTVKLLENLDVNLKRIKTSVEKVSNKQVKSTIHPEEAGKSGYIQAKHFDKALLSEQNDVKRIMGIAHNRLREANFEIFGTEQLLEAIVQDKAYWLSDVLAGEGVNAENLSEKVRSIGSRAEEYEEGSPEFTPKAYDALCSAYDIAKELGSTHIKPEHILLGTLRENKGLACKALKELDIDVDELYKKIITPIEREKPETLSILNLAKEEAIMMEQNIVGTEQILLGILGAGTGIGAKVLRDLGVTLKDTRAEVMKAIGVGNQYSEQANIVYTPRAKRVITLAWMKARKLGKPRYSSEHLLLAITKEKESIAMKVLENLGVDTVEITQGILNEIRKASASGNIE